jgi:hypothetical protein
MPDREAQISQSESGRPCCLGLPNWGATQSFQMWVLDVTFARFAGY